MTPEPSDHATRAVAERLATFRPASAPSALRERLRAQHLAKPVVVIVPFPRWKWARVAAVVAILVVIGAILFPRRQPAGQHSLVQEPPGVPAVPQRLLSVREIGLVRRVNEPPVQLLAVEDVTIAAALGGAVADSKVSITTRIVPVVLEYH